MEWRLVDWLLSRWGWWWFVYSGDDDVGAWQPWLIAVVASMVVVRVAEALAEKDKGAEIVAVMLLTSEWRWGNDEGSGVWRGGGAWRRVMVGIW
ncbi:hypothetical protein Tco_0772243 [Tanacetum coccineum]|uniref:Uncharacterized protein n=1 Tax=Tanacetum coccineum TaxID=301880 RepID=A0ABQ4ZKY9_9ASTR